MPADQANVQNAASGSRTHTRGWVIPLTSIGLEMVRLAMVVAICSELVSQSWVWASQKHFWPAVAGCLVLFVATIALQWRVFASRRAVKVAAGEHAREVSSSARKTYALVGGLLALVAVGLIYYEFVANGWQLDKIPTPLAFAASTVIALLSSNLVFEFISTKSAEEVVDRAITAALHRDANVYFDWIARMDEPARVTFLQNAVQRIGGSLLGRADGNLLWTDLLARYVEKKSGFRQEFTYRIEIVRSTEQSGLVQTLAAFGAIDPPQFCRRYHLCTQTISYAKDGGVTGADGKVVVVFAFDLQTLQRYMPRGDVYFRDILTLDDALLARMRELDEGQIKQLVTKGWAFRAHCMHTDTNLEYEVQLTNVDSERRIIRIKIDPGTLIGLDQLIRLTFTVPHEQAWQSYLVQLPEPIKDPNIYFDLKLPGNILRSFPFFGSRASPEIELTCSDQESHVHIKVPGWTFPTSGVVFAWDRPFADGLARAFPGRP
jgi:hypothetical protein